MAFMLYELFYILLLLSCCAVSTSFSTSHTNTVYTKEYTEGRYIAAVYEHAVVTPIIMATNHREAVAQMMVNLKEYQRQAVFSHEHNAQIIVFPEDGIYGLIRDREHMKYYIEDIPDPRSLSWIPCDEQERFPQDLDVLIFLSCLAKNSKLYLVANYGDAKKCQPSDPNCPKDGQYQYNTDLAFDPDGKFIAKYHKQNLYYENQFDEPITPQYIYFDTDFGRFGMFTCFDILFHEPMIPLIEKYNITDVAFPTAWMDVMPYFSAIGYHSSVAAAYNLNILAANIHLPLFRFQGSGIYTPGGANIFYYDRSSIHGKLLISSVESIKQPFPKTNRLTNMSTLKYNKSLEPQMAAVFGDWYHIDVLEESIGTLQVCQRGLCCFLEYETGELNDLYAFGVFNGKHREEGEYYLQVCLLLTCATSDVSSCGQSTFTANTKFKSIRMSGTFQTQYVTPQVLLADNGTLRLPVKETLTYSDGELFARDSSYPVLESCLFGRMYDRD